MNEKLKPNFTPIPNVILDEIMRTLAPGATKVLFAICRYTYGWGKPAGDRISLKQLQEITGMARGSVVRSVKELGPLVTVTAGDPSRQLASEYRINVEISDDDLVSLRDQPLVSKRDQASLLASLPGETFQRKSKERRNGASRKKRERAVADPRVKTLINAFRKKYAGKVGKAYAPTWGKDGELIKQLLAADQSPEAIDSAMDLYFADGFYSTKTGFDIGGFRKAYNRLNSAGAKKKHNYEEGTFPSL